MWDSGECFIIAGGPSWLYQFDIPQETIDAVLKQSKHPSVLSPYLKLIHGKHIIGVNNAYQLGVWINIVFFGDCSWYNVHRRALVDFPGIKITSCQKRDFQPEENIKILERDKTHKKGISTHKSKVSWNHNSGAAAISVAAHLGVKRIILMGFDMAFDKNSKYSHFHGSHRKDLKSPPFKRHLTGFPQIAKDAKELGIEIINTSPDSQIDIFPKINIKELI
jgi:hypothetical protein